MAKIRPAINRFIEKPGCRRSNQNVGDSNKATRTQNAKSLVEKSLFILLVVNSRQTGYAIHTRVGKVEMGE